MKHKVLWGIALLGSGCTNYRGSFDCTPQSGAGCKSVSQIEAMIQENEDTEDYFINLRKPQKKKEGLETFLCTQKPEPLEGRKKKTIRIWLCPSTTSSGHYEEGHYIHCELDENDLEQLLQYPEKEK